MRITPTAAPVGADVAGVDLAGELSPDLLSEIAGAVHRFGVLVFRDQHLSDAEHLRFSNALGPSRKPPEQESARFLVPGMPELLRLSNIFENGHPIGIMEAGQYWHSDRSFDARPDGYAILQALRVPRDRNGNALGDTLFVSAAHAYDTLDADTRNLIEDLSAVHYYQNPYSRHRFSDTRKKIKIEEERLGTTVHPVVRTHPFTGRRSVYVNQHYTMSIVGMDDIAGRKLIDRLCAHSTRDDFQYRHRWQEGDVLLWDDIGIQHHAVGDYSLEQPRLVQRTTLDYVWPALTASRAGAAAAAAFSECNRDTA